MEAGLSAPVAAPLLAAELDELAVLLGRSTLLTDIETARVKSLMYRKSLLDGERPARGVRARVFEDETAERVVERTAAQVRLVAASAALRSGNSYADYLNADRSDTADLPEGVAAGFEQIAKDVADGRTDPDGYDNQASLREAMRAACAHAAGVPPPAGVLAPPPGDGSDAVLSWRARMVRVLTAYVVRRPMPGYAQGLNDICACLLVIMGGDEEAAFWALVALVEDLRDRDFYAEPPAAMNGFKAETECLAHFVGKAYPALLAVVGGMGELRQTVEMLAPKLLIPLFVDVTPFTTLVAIWAKVFQVPPRAAAKFAAGAASSSSFASSASASSGEGRQGGGAGEEGFWKERAGRAWGPEHFVFGDLGRCVAKAAAEGLADLDLVSTFDSRGGKVFGAGGAQSGGDDDDDDAPGFPALVAAVALVGAGVASSVAAIGEGQMPYAVLLGACRACSGAAWAAECARLEGPEGARLGICRKGYREAHLRAKRDLSAKWSAPSMLPKLAKSTHFTKVELESLQKTFAGLNQPGGLTLFQLKQVCTGRPFPCASVSGAANTRASSPWQELATSSRSVFRALLTRTGSIVHARLVFFCFVLHCGRHCARPLALQVVRNAKVALPDAALERLFQVADTDESGMVDFKEVALILSTLVRGSMREKAELCFSLYDADGR